ncbi:unnamed protein product [Spirodela intermedia]|uniref:BTB domain-containing protein n=1 Tax=Spirodela intermedia TaxID=51605 RepID=A0A7I8LEJ6_SPIIN|nr:unnamed protein product [Spirodela intermedia]
MESGTDRVRFNVGGRIFETTATTLAGAGRQSMLGAVLDEDWNVRGAAAGEYFIDRNPACFAVLLDLLRTGELHLPPTIPEKLLCREALYYGLLDHVRAAKWSPLDGNRLQLARTVTGRAPGDGAAIRAGPDGGCCVAHGSMVHVYNWMLDELKPITLDYLRVNDAGYMDFDKIVVTASERPGRGDGGLGLFSSSTGELRHRFQVTHQNQFKSFTAGALTFDHAGRRIFASCKGRFNEYGIGVWDQVTGQQTDFFYELAGTGGDTVALGEADKLQWLEGNRCLMTATLFPKADHCFIGLLDFREKKVAWSWSDGGSIVPPDEKQVLAAVAMEEGGPCICVVNQYDDLGFLDLRGGAAGRSIRWNSRSRFMRGKMDGMDLCFPKLEVNDGQLFSSMNESISVFSGPEWVLTSRLSSSSGGSMSDISIAGDRLFALHSDENVFDVWETPPLPTM